MSGYELEVEQLRRAATAARSGGDQLGEVDAPASMSAVPAALSGCRCGGPLVTLADSWQQQVVHWQTALLDHAAHLAHSADVYAANEQAAAEVFAPAHVGGQEAY